MAVVVFKLTSLCQQETQLVVTPSTITVDGMAPKRCTPVPTLASSIVLAKVIVGATRDKMTLLKCWWSCKW
jgi:hypothetical protein